MRATSFHIIRVGLGITFLWIGVLIIRDPQAWGGYLQPWATGLLPIPLTQAMITTAVTDIVIGILLLTDIFTWIAALLAALHLLSVLIGSGITDITVRDVGLFSITLAILKDTVPGKIVSTLFFFLKKDPEKQSSFKQ